MGGEIAMVIPLPNSMPPPLAGPPSEDLAPAFRKINVCVWVMMGSWVAKLVVGSFCYGFLVIFGQSMNLSLNILVGIFLLRDDPKFGNIHQCLMTTVFQLCNNEQCPGSMTCLLPFVICSFMMVTMDIFFNTSFETFAVGLIVLFNKQAWEKDAVNQIIIFAFTMTFLAALLSQCCAAWFGWNAYKQAMLVEGGITSTPGTWGRDRLGGDGDRLGGNPGGRGSYNPPAYRPTTSGGGSSRAPGPWEPFSGAGHKLGTSR